jgi:hypothetical protein
VLANIKQVLNLDLKLFSECYVNHQKGPNNSMLHNMEMVMGFDPTILPAQRKRERKESHGFGVNSIFVEAPIEALTHNITLMCECVNFLVWLTFMITVVPFQIRHKLNCFLIC